MDKTAACFCSGNEFLNDFKTVHIGDIIHIFAFGRPGQTEPVPTTRKNIPVFTELDAFNSFDNLFLNIFVHIIKIFTGSDKPVERFKILDKSNFREILSFHIRFRPVILVKAFRSVLHDINHIFDNKLSFCILHFKQLFSF